MGTDLENALADQHLVEKFLYQEAELLDNFKLIDWLDLLSPDIDYRIPTRTTRLGEDTEQEFSSDTFFMVETYESLKVRMERFGLGGWSEFPPSRTRRHVTNIRVTRIDGETLRVKSNLLCYWARDMDHEIISCERQDTLTGELGLLKLQTRRVLLDHVSLPVPSLTLAL